MDRNPDTIYVIKEQGDLSLFADPISDEDQETIEQNWKKQQKKDNKEDN